VRLDRVIERSLAVPDSYLRRGDASVEVRSMTMDSRAVVPGTLFACVPGANVDGHAYAPAAVAAGAVALLVERFLDLDVAQVVVPSVRAVLGPVASAVYGDPSADLTVVGVTGTNGKTTTVTMLAEIFAAAGWSAAALGTLTQVRTTPEAPELQARLAELRDEGRCAVAMEVSSHALHQHRVASVRFAAAVLTNVTQDHLDYHGTMERYFEAKASLFDEGRSAVGVVNRDDPWGARLVERLSGRHAPLVTFGIDDAVDLRLDSTGSRFGWRGREIRLRLGGRFNVLNALAAAAAADAVGVEGGAVVEGLGRLERVRGRFEAVDAGQDFTVLVDYAHTPDGLVQALGAARELTAGRLIAVVGAGGDRDHEKRPLMGAAAAAADLVILTSDNPRYEDPGAIIEQVRAGVPPGAAVEVMIERADAIGAALAVARTGDVVVVAGKGHEQGQEIAGQVRPFDDAGVVRATLARILDSRRHGGAR
jgi:UDP-N-acetylmuramoyl-L-alanyl-D-glutamate--2,6-diaminopimelate ligase